MANQMVQLSYTQTKILADALEPILKEQKNRPNVAKLFDVKKYVIQRIIARKAKTRIALTSFEAVVTKLGVNTQGWDLRL